MSREKQIEEMAKLACVGFREGDCENCKSVGICSSYTISKKLYNAGYRKQEWISVDERLPEKSGDVLAYTTVKTYITLHYSAKHKLFNSYDDDSRVWAERYCVDVTHWMPLPEPPKMKGGAE